MCRYRQVDLDEFGTRRLTSLKQQEVVSLGCQRINMKTMLHHYN